MRALRLRSGPGLPRERGNGGDMDDEGIIKADAYVKKQLANWDRALLIVSVPHGAALSAFIGRYNIEANLEGAGLNFNSITILVMIPPILSLWLFFAHDLLRNSFLRSGLFGAFISVKYSVVFFSTFLSPLIIGLLANYFDHYTDRLAVMLIGMTMTTWVFCLTVVANDLYMKIVKALGHRDVA
jgi:hypothetical protein